MVKKQMQWKTKGMNKDLSASAFNSEFSFENMNLRLSTNESNTQLSWVNEKGTKKVGFQQGETLLHELSGTAIGTAVINNQLVVFTTGDTDRIYKLEDRRNSSDSDYSSYSMDSGYSLKCTLLFSGKLGFEAEHPLETLVSYESDSVQKVYWVDGKNQPRMINIADKNKRMSNGVEDYFFDFVPSISYPANWNVTVELSSGGLFAPGVIQYCFTYINKNGQQSNVVWCSSLYYLTHPDRGASPEEKTGNSFIITIKHPDTNFDYIRLYSIQRTSKDATPFVKQLDDIGITGDSISYTDNGTTGLSIDPTELLFVGGKEIIAGTMADKDGTLFLGNIEEENVVTDELQAKIKGAGFSIEFKVDDSQEDDKIKTLDLDAANTVYSYTNQLREHSKRKITTFKGGEYYRFGFQLQKRTGEWSDPIFINDAKNELYPVIDWSGGKAYLPYATCDINVNIIKEGLPEKIRNNFNSIYKKIRPVVVYPGMGDRQVICQGVINPTVFNSEDRKNNSPFAQASWYYRPYCTAVDSSEDVVKSDLMSYLEKQGVEIEDLGKLNKTHTVDSTTKSAPELDDIDGEKINSNTTQHNPSLHYSYDIVSIMVAKVPVSNIDTVFSRSRLTYTISDGTKRELDYIGAIRLDNNANAPEYAFVVIGETREVFPSNVTYDHLDNTSIFYSIKRYNGDLFTHQIYTNMYTTDDMQLFYIEPAEFAPYDTSANPTSNYTFGFYVEESSNSYRLYTVEFNKLVGNQGTIHIDPNNRPETIVKTNGSNIEYSHYHSLPVYMTYSNSWYKNAEIQGAVKLYNDVYSQEPISGVNTNMQFFVDQSIVTLNSPDLEFDTMVQSTSTEDLKLRIVGVIPITGGASAHHITTSSAMVEVNRNRDNGREEPFFGRGELDRNILFNGNNRRVKHLVSEELWEDSEISQYNVGEGGKDVQTAKDSLAKYMVYPWQRKGSLNNDSRSVSEASSVLSTKKESNLLYSRATEYFDCVEMEAKTDVQFILTENAEVMNYRFPRQFEGDDTGINYYPNVDKVLYNESGFYTYSNKFKTEGNTDDGKYVKVSGGIAMKYLSTTHAAIVMGGLDSSYSMHNNDSRVLLMPYGKISTENTEEVHLGEFGMGSGITFWGDSVSFAQEPKDIRGLASNNYNFLWLGELYKENDNNVNRFGGTSKAALRSNYWQVGGESVDLSAGTVTLKWTEGDTYYQRYDSLKTYAFTPEDSNQIVEILSFMCESRVNLDGRWDKNRGQIDNTNMSPRNFNRMNDVYSQTNDFFINRKSGVEDEESTKHPNYITYSKTKTAGADVDLWTNVTLGSVLELDGDKGSVQKLMRLNDQLLCFQDRGICQILYNENVQIQSTQGVPIEIANSGKVQGKRYLSNTVGCSNKWSIVQTPAGIYFMDSNEKSIYRLGQGLENVSLKGGMDTWCKQNIPSSEVKWNPVGFDTFRSIYDSKNQDVMFINKETALAFSEKLGTFTSFYSYGNSPFFCNVGDKRFWLRSDSSGVQTLLWEHEGGEYCKFFDKQEPYWMTLVSNDESHKDKTFTNLDMRACVDGDGEYNSKGMYVPYVPFDDIETWNEYQHGKKTLSNTNSYYGRVYKSMESNSTIGMSRGFRIWSCDVPRDDVRKLDRMRNTWLYVKLAKQADTQRRTEIHDLIMTYFG